MTPLWIFLLLKIYCIFHFFCRFLYLIIKYITQMCNTTPFIIYLSLMSTYLFYANSLFLSSPRGKTGCLNVSFQGCPFHVIKTLFLQPLKTLYLLYFQSFPLTSLLTFVSKKHAGLLPILGKTNKLLFIAIFFLWTIFLIPLSNVWNDLYPMPLFSKHLFFTLPSTIPLQTPLTPLL